MGFSVASRTSALSGFALCGLAVENRSHESTEETELTEKNVLLSSLCLCVSVVKYLSHHRFEI